MTTWLKNWFAKEPAILWALLTNSVLAGTIWGVLPQFGIHVPVAWQPIIVVAVNAINAAVAIRPNVTPVAK